MRAFGKKPATYEDLLAVPDTLVAELIGGELLVSPRPTLEHSGVSTALVGGLSGPFERGRGGPGGWWIRFEPELHFGTEVVVPDVAGWKRERCPMPPSGAFTTLAPDWICEVLSPSTGRVDRMKKLPLYLREGVLHAWIIDRSTQTLEVFRSENSRWILAASFVGTDPVRAEPFDAIELELGALWPMAPKLE